MTEPNAPAWADQLPDDLKSNETLTQFETIGAMGTRLLELEGNQGDAVRIPGKDASDEDRATFFTQLGRPAEASGYELSLPEKFPEKMGPSDEEKTADREAMFKLGLSSDQAQGLFQHAMGRAQANFDALTAQREKYRTDNETALKQEWGSEFDAKLTLANKVVDKFGDETLVKYLNDTQLGNWTPLAKLLAAVGAQFSDDVFVKGDPPGGGDEDKRPVGIDGKRRFSYETG